MKEMFKIISDWENINNLCVFIEDENKEVYYVTFDELQENGIRKIHSDLDFIDNIDVDEDEFSRILQKLEADNFVYFKGN